MGQPYWERDGQPYRSMLAGVLFFGRRFLGSAWGPVAAVPDSPYHIGAVRPRIPVAEPLDITHAMRMLRSVGFRGAVHWGADGLYALGIIIAGSAATVEERLVISES